MRLISIFLLVTTFLVARPDSVRAQLLNDRPALQLIEKAVDHVYNAEYDEANTLAKQLQARHPNHPVNYFLKAFQMTWQYLPIKDNKAKVGEYIKTLNQCLVAVERHYGKNSPHPEAVFFTMAARGYLGLMYNYQNELLKAAGEAQKAYGSLVEGLKLTEKNPEFYFTTGMYNYYVETYPEDHPIVKPLMVFFKDGNKALGLKQLDIATRNAIMTRVEATYFLAHIYLEHESRPDKAIPYTTRLHAWYPGNTIFSMIHIETLILAGRYQEAQKVMDKINKRNDGFYPIAWHVFEGLIREKQDRQDNEAQKYYLMALKIPHDDQYTREYHAMAYAGLARIADRSGNRNKAREHYKKCLEKANYNFLEREAQAYLK